MDMTIDDAGQYVQSAGFDRFPRIRHCIISVFRHYPTVMDRQGCPPLLSPGYDSTSADNAINDHGITHAANMADMLDTRAMAAISASAAFAEKIRDAASRRHHIGAADPTRERPAVSIYGHANLFNRVAPDVNHLNGHGSLRYQHTGRLPGQPQAADVCREPTMVHKISVQLER